MIDPTVSANTMIPQTPVDLCIAAPSYSGASGQSAGAPDSSSLLSALLPNQSNASIQGAILRDVRALILNIAQDVLGALRAKLSQDQPCKPGTTDPAPAPTTTTPAPTGSTTTPPSDSTTDSTPDPATDGSQPVADAPNPSTTQSASPSDFLKSFLTPNANGDFHEEQLQYGVAGYLLSQRSSALLNSYQTAMGQYRAQAGSRASYEDGVKIALKQLVANNQISRSDAEKIAGISFRAAQLDNNLNALYDDISGGSDTTAAVMESSKAAAKVEKTLDDVLAGKISAPPRSLDAPSTGSTTDSNPAPATPVSTDLTGFVWKPISTIDRKVSVTFPSSMAGEISSVSLYQSLPINSSTLIEQATSEGTDADGNALFGFKKQGRSYPDGVYVVAQLTDGEQVQVKITDASRTLKK